MIARFGDRMATMSELSIQQTGSVVHRPTYFPHMLTSVECRASNCQGSRGHLTSKMNGTTPVTLSKRGQQRR